MSPYKSAEQQLDRLNRQWAWQQIPAVLLAAIGVVYGWWLLLGGVVVIWLVLHQQVVRHRQSLLNGLIVHGENQLRLCDLAPDLTERAHHG